MIDRPRATAVASETPAARPRGGTGAQSARVSAIPRTLLRLQGEAGNSTVTGGHCLPNRLAGLAPAELTDLQRAVGNRAVTALLRSGSAVWLQRQASATQTPRPPTPARIPGTIFGVPCTPYNSRTEAELGWQYAINYLLYASRFGADTVRLWALYMDKGSAAVPRPLQVLTHRASIVAGFTTHHITAEAEEALMREVINGVNGGSIAVTPGTPRRMALADVIGAGTVFTMLNRGSHAMNFDQVANTIPGNIAGGVGEGGPPGHTISDPDTRNAWGDVVIRVAPGAGGAGGTVSVTPSLNFHVHDTIDFCPGAIGDAAAQMVTIAMSRLEKTESRFGPVFAADVPFDIDFPGPGVTLTAPYAPPPPAPPPPPVVLPMKVLFGYNSAEVTVEGKKRLRALLPRVQRSPSTSIVGHADSRGSRSYNQGLSERRAQAVADELIRQDPSLAGRLRPSGRGEDEPVLPNASTEAEHAENRRVELIFGP